MKRFLTMLMAVISLFVFALMPISCNVAPQNGDGTSAPDQTTTSPDTTTAPPADGECAHEYLDFTTEPTYTTKGFTTHTCKKCGDSYVDSYIDPWADVVLQYDDYVTSLGDISATSASATFEGDDAIEVVTKNNVKYFRAKNVGVTTVKDGDKSVVVGIAKARLHLVVVMGQSNAGCHFANAMSDVVCDLGTAYWWGANIGPAVTKPIDYTRPSTGFHTPLIAELRAQSVAAGEPEKPVMIWHEGATSKNGKPITSWATSATETSGTDDTVKMITNCINYYTAPERADKYEIVESGMYWLQGEGGADPA